MKRILAPLCLCLVLGALPAASADGEFRDRELVGSVLALSAVRADPKTKIPMLPAILEKAPEDRRELWTALLDAKEASLAEDFPAAAEKFAALLEANDRDFLGDMTHALAVRELVLALWLSGKTAEAVSLADEFGYGYLDREEPEFIEMAGGILLAKALIILRHGDLLPAFRDMRQVVERLETREEPRLAEQARLFKGMMTELQGRFGINAEALESESDAMVDAFDADIDRHWDSSDPDEERIAAAAMLSKAAILSQRGDKERAEELYGMLTRRFADRPEPGLAGVAAEAMLLTGLLMQQRGDMDEADALLGDLARQYGGRSDEAIRTTVARGVFARATPALMRGELAAIASMDEAIALAGDSDDPSLRELAAGAFAAKVVLYSQNDMLREAGETYVQFNNRFKDDTAPAVRQRLQQAGALVFKNLQKLE